jgi:hypothetical protein
MAAVIATNADRRQSGIAGESAASGVFGNKGKEAGRYPARVGDHS